MPIDQNWMLLSLLVSSIGTGLFLYGKKEARLSFMLAGGTYCLYPYLVRNMLLMVMIGAALGIVLWFAAKLDL